MVCSRRFLTGLFLLIFPLTLSAITMDLGGGPDLTNPNSSIYRTYEQWHAAGLISQLPHLMPFPMQVHRELLREVLAHPRTPEREAQTARELLRRLEPAKGKPAKGKPAKGKDPAAGAERTDTGDGRRGGSAAVRRLTEIPGGRGSFVQGEMYGIPWLTDGLYGQETGTDCLHGESGIGILAGTDLTRNSTLLLHWPACGVDAAHVNPQIDTFDDNAKVSVKGRQIDLRQSFNNVFAWGSKDLYLQGGISRTSIGPTYNTNGVLSGQAEQLPNFSVAWNPGRFAYTSTYLEITATNYLGEGQFADKRMMLQTLSWQPPGRWLDGLELGIYQTAVYGGRFDLLYFVPFSFLFYNQSINGFRDNSLMGGFLTYNFGPGFSYRTVGYVDDADFNRLIRFDFGGKNKMVWENELAWTPLFPWLRRFALSYTMVTPYMYTHRGYRFYDTLVQDYQAETGDSGDFGTGDYDGSLHLDEIEDLTGDTGKYYLNLLEENPNYSNYTHQGESLGLQMRPNTDRLSLQYRAEPVRGLFFLGRGYFERHGNATAELRKKGEYEYNSNPSQVTEEGGLYDDGYDDERYATFNDGVGFLTQSVLERKLRLDGTLGYTLRVGEHEAALAGGVVYTYLENAGLEKGKSDYSLQGLISFVYRYTLW